MKRNKHCLKIHFTQLEGFSSSSSSNNCSMVTLNTPAILRANLSDGLYVPFSKYIMVCLVTPTFSASASCDMRSFCLRSFIRFFTWSPSLILLKIYAINWSNAKSVSLKMYPSKFFVNLAVECIYALVYLQCFQYG